MLQKELAQLQRLRGQGFSAVLSTAKGCDDGWVNSMLHQALVGEQDRNRRIRQIQEILINSVVGDEAPDDGVAEPGMVLTVRFEADPVVETFLLAHRAGVAHSDVEVCSPDSPLGRTLCGAREGEWRQYQLPGRRTMTVQLVRAVPYRERILDSPEPAEPLRCDTSIRGRGVTSE
jgi:transcription elongation factor GreA